MTAIFYFLLGSLTALMLYATATLVKAVLMMVRLCRA